MTFSAGLRPSMRAMREGLKKPNALAVLDCEGVCVREDGIAASVQMHDRSDT